MFRRKALLVAGGPLSPLDSIVPDGCKKSFIKIMAEDIEYLRQFFSKPVAGQWEPDELKLIQFGDNEFTSKMIEQEIPEGIDFLLFYFAGHGGREPEQYICLSENEILYVSAIKTMLENLKVKRYLAIINACRTHQAPQSPMIAQTNIDVSYFNLLVAEKEDYNQQLAKLKVNAILNTTSDGDRALYTDSGNYFTDTLILEVYHQLDFHTKVSLHDILPIVNKSMERVGQQAELVTSTADEPFHFPLAIRKP